MVSRSTSPVQALKVTIISVMQGVKDGATSYH